MRSQGLVRLFLAAGFASFLACAVALAGKGNGNGGGGGNGGGNGGGGGGSAPSLPGEISTASSEWSPTNGDESTEFTTDGSSFETIPACGDASNRSFANGERWYLETRTSGASLPFYENGVYQGEVPNYDVFAVNSLTGDAMQLTNLSQSGVYLTEGGTWARDAGDSYVFFEAQDFSPNLILVNGLPALDLTNYSSYDPYSILRLDVSSADVDAAYRGGGALPPASTSNLLSINYGAAEIVNHFRASPDGTTGLYRQNNHTFRVFDMATGATLAILPSALHGAFSHDSSQIVYTTGGGDMYVYSLSSGSTTFITGETNRDQYNLMSPVFSLDDSAIAYTARVHVGKNNYDGKTLLIDSTGERYVISDESRRLRRWVED